MLEQAVFFQAKLEYPHCREANFTDAIFCEAIISDANFQECIFERTDFSGVTITDSTFSQVQGKPRFLGVHAKDVKFYDAHIHADSFFPKDSRYQLTKTKSGLFSLTTQDKSAAPSLLDSFRKLF